MEWPLLFNFKEFASSLILQRNPMIESLQNCPNRNKQKDLVVKMADKFFNCTWILWCYDVLKTPSVKIYISKVIKSISLKSSFVNICTEPFYNSSFGHQYPQISVKIKLTIRFE